MSVRVAAASSDGKVVNRHFGAARQFLVFDVDQSGISFVELRKSEAPCNQGEHSDEKLLASVELISDCRLVLVNKIGPVAKSHLSFYNIDAIETSAFITEAIESLLKSKYFINNYLKQNA